MKKFFVFVVIVITYVINGNAQVTYTELQKPISEDVKKLAELTFKRKTLDDVIVEPSLIEQNNIKDKIFNEYNGIDSLTIKKISYTTTEKITKHIPTGKSIIINGKVCPIVNDVEKIVEVEKYKIDFRNLEEKLKIFSNCDASDEIIIFGNLEHTRTFYYMLKKCVGENVEIKDKYYYGFEGYKEIFIVKRKNDNGVPFFLLETKPSFEGGDTNEFSKWVNKNLDEKIKTRVRVPINITTQFTIDEEGNLINPKILRGFTKEYEDEAIRVLKLSPKWEPGKLNGKNVKVTYTFRIVFQLEKTTK